MSNTPCTCNANEDCTQSCSVANCEIACKNESIRNADRRTSATACKQTCESGADCTFDCTLGGCTQLCKAGSKCKLTCAGGNCNMTCEAGATCEADCTATNNCTCTGTKC